MMFRWPIDWKLAFKNLLRNKRRSIVTGLAVGCGYVGMILLGAYINRAQMGLQASTIYAQHKGHFSLMKPDSLDFFQAKPRRYLISRDELDQLAPFFKQESQIDFTARYLTGMGLLQAGTKSTPFVALGVEPDAFARVFNNPDLIHWARDWIEAKDVTNDYDALKRDPHVVSVTRLLANLVDRHPPFEGAKPDDLDVQLIGKNFYGDLNAVSAKLGPIHTTGIALAEDSSLIAPLAMLQDLYATDGVEYVALFLKNTGDMSRVRRDLQKYLNQKNINLNIVPFSNDRWSPFYAGTMSFLYVMGAFFLLLICGTVALSVVNSTAMGILERSREIGTLRALGFEPLFIRRLFVKESIALSICAIAVGVVVAEIIAAVVNIAGIHFHPPGTLGPIKFQLYLNPSLCIAVALLLIGINTFTAWLTTRGRLGKKVVQLLSDSGA